MHLLAQVAIDTITPLVIQFVEGCLILLLSVVDSGCIACQQIAGTSGL